MLGHLVCDDPQLVRIGLPVCVGFASLHAGVALPKFFPSRELKGYPEGKKRPRVTSAGGELVRRVA